MLAYSVTCTSVHLVFTSGDLGHFTLRQKEQLLLPQNEEAGATPQPWQRGEGKLPASQIIRGGVSATARLTSGKWH
jgi:hypothetical protein